MLRSLLAVCVPALVPVTLAVLNFIDMSTKLGMLASVVFVVVAANSLEATPLPKRKTK